MEWAGDYLKDFAEQRARLRELRDATLQVAYKARREAGRLQKIARVARARADAILVKMPARPTTPVCTEPTCPNQGKPLPWIARETGVMPGEEGRMFALYRCPVCGQMTTRPFRPDD